jgi:hypothetical protein
MTSTRMAGNASIRPLLLAATQLDPRRPLRDLNDEQELAAPGSPTSRLFSRGVLVTE